MKLSICLLGAACSQNTRSLAEAWTKLGHTVRILTFHGQQWGEIPVHTLRARFGKASYGLSAIQVRTRVHDMNPHVVVGYHITSYGFVATTVGFHPLVTIAAGGDILPEQYGSPLRSWALPRVARWVMSKSDLTFSWAEHLTERLIALGASPGQVVTMPRGIDVNTFVQSRGRHHTGGEPIRIITTRSLKRLYATDILIRALARINELHGPSTVTTILGEGPERQSLEALRDSMGLNGSIYFTGAIANVEVARFLHRNDIYVSVARSDGVSASLLEAMSAGLVPIVSDIPANRQWISHGNNGLLVAPNDVQALSEAIIRIATDHDLHLRCRSTNPVLVESQANLNINAARIAQQIEQLVTRRMQGRYGSDPLSATTDTPTCAD